MLIRFLVVSLILGMSCGSMALAQDKDKKKEKNPLEGKKGTVIGMLTNKGPAFIEVKADGEEKGRRYIPHWVGGSPAKGGGPDKNMLKIIHDLKVGSRLEVQWEFEEHVRVIGVKVLRAPVDQPDKKVEEKRGKTVGTLQAREEGKWIEVKGDGEEKARKYHVHAKLPEKLLQSVRQAPIGSRVSVELVSTNHGPIIHGIEVLVAPRKD